MMYAKSITLLAWLGFIFFTTDARGQSPSEVEAMQNADEGDVVYGVIPDIRVDDTKLKFQDGDFVVVPVPFSNPTFDTGLVVGSAYFYPQTKKQKESQPASVTGVAGLYSSNDSFAYGVGHLGYWDEDNWRFNGALAKLDLNLDLRTRLSGSTGQEALWLIDGDLIRTQISRRVFKKWYVGLVGQYIDFNQQFLLDEPIDSRFGLGLESKQFGVGLSIDYDARDNPFNATSGMLFEIDAMHQDDSAVDRSYQSYSIKYHSYHRLSKAVVLAWEVQGCYKDGTPPLWDTCRIPLRGFSATDYMGKSSAAGQIEARWQFRPRWGAVGFAGAGYSGSSFGELRDSDRVPSYGIGLRFMVLQSKRVNLRIDYARSDAGDAIHFSVGEAF